MAVEGFILRMIIVLSTLAFSFVVRNQSDGQQWATWWWVCILGLVVFIPTIFVLSGHWKPAISQAQALRQGKEVNSIQQSTNAETIAPTEPA